MKNKEFNRLSYFKVAFALFFVFAVYKTNAEDYNESTVRYIMLDISLGGTLSFYSNASDANSMEAVSRWNSGVRIQNSSSFERKNLGGNLGWTMVYKNTEQRIPGMIAWLNNEDYNESTVRYIMLDISLGGTLSFYSNASDANSMEAVSRWNSGVRVQNSSSFERKDLGGNLGWTMVYKNTEQRVPGMIVWLSNENYNESEVRYKMLDISLGGSLSFYSSATDANSMEAVSRWNSGISVQNSSSFERKDLGGNLGWTMVYKNTEQRVPGMIVWLNMGLGVGVLDRDYKSLNSYILSQNYPNPFNPTTTLSFSLPEEEYVQLVIYNSQGEKVQKLVNGLKAAGNYKVNFNASSLASGVYFYSLITYKYSETKKMLLIK